MKTEILWTRRARRDLLEIGDFFARDKPEAAARWIGKILNTVERTARFPTSGRIVPEIERTDVREVVLGSYRIVYQVAKSGIVILSVFESHRLIDRELVVSEHLQRVVRPHNGDRSRHPRYPVL